MKKLFALLLVVAMVFGMAACGSSADGNEKASGTEDGVTKWVIGYSYHNMDENITKSWLYQEKAWKAWDAAHDEVEVELLVTDDGGSLEKQQTDVESLITRGVDAINIMVVDSEGCIPIIEYIVDNGVYCFDNGYIANTDVSDFRLQGSDPHTQGVLIYEAVSQYLDENPDAVLNCGWFYGMATASATLARHDGVDMLLEEYPDRFKVCDEQHADWLTDKAMTIMESWLLAYPEMNCVLAASDDMAIGAINTLIEQGRDPKEWVIYSIDGSQSGFNQVAAGNLDGTVLMAQGVSSAYMVDIMASYMLGMTTSVDYGVDLTPHTKINLGTLTSQMVTIDNLDEMTELAGVEKEW